jgi:hypothetical protein
LRDLREEENRHDLTLKPSDAQEKASALNQQTIEINKQLTQLFKETQQKLQEHERLLKKKKRLQNEQIGFDKPKESRNSYISHLQSHPTPRYGVPKPPQPHLQPFYAPQPQPMHDQSPDLMRTVPMPV